MTQVEKNYLTQLVNFLKQNNALIDFKQNIINYGGKDKLIMAVNPLGEFKKRYLVTKNNITRLKRLYLTLIEKAFSWKRTSQGFSYWEQLDAKWQMEFLKNQRKI